MLKRLNAQTFLIVMASLVVTTFMPAMTLADESPAAEKPKFPSLEDVTKDMVEITSSDGGALMTLYRYEEDDLSKNQMRLLARIPRSLLNQDLLLANTVTGGAFTGYQWGSGLVRWSIRGNRVILEAPDTRIAQPSNANKAEVIERTYPSQILTGLPIVTMVGGDPVVDLSPMFTSAAVGLPGSGRPDMGLSAYRSIKVFPENVLIEVDIAMNSRGVFENIGMAFAFRKLPALGSYKPRAADERVGYFITSQQDWTTPHTELSNFTRHINRWKLEKLDPSLTLSPPKEPIVFIIDKATPIQWRRWVKAGVLEWNKAFERIGFVDAIVVQQQTDDNEYANHDPADARYNFIRWIVSGRPFAMGPSRVDPRTGQILDADIIVDDSFLRFMTEDVDLFGRKATSAFTGPALFEMIQQYPDMFPADFREGMMDVDPENTEHHKLGDTNHFAMGCEHEACQMQVGLGQELMLMQVAAMTAMHQSAQQAIANGTSNTVDLASGNAIPERIIGSMIKELMSHEVGHTLGLRHNFKASSWLSIDEIKTRRDRTGEPTTASVMDYNATLFFAGDDLETLSTVDSPTIGPYDEWAIEYGYKIPGASDGGEASMLNTIASRSGEPQLAYATDEDTMWVMSPDPLVNRWDMGDDHIAWSKSRIALVDELKKDFEEATLNGNPDNSYLRRVYLTLFFERGSSMQNVARYVTGMNVNRNRLTEEDAKPIFEIVDGDKQREALAFLGETVFADDFYDFDPELLNNLVTARWRDWTNRRVSSRTDLPVHDMVLRLQSNVLTNLVLPPVLQRAYDNELKSNDPNKFTTAELLTTVRDIIFAELNEAPKNATNAEPYISSIRRNLQTEYLGSMFSYADPKYAPGVSKDIQTMVRTTLRELAARINSELEANGEAMDVSSRGHLYELQSIITRRLDKKY